MEADGNPAFETGFGTTLTGLTPGQTYELDFYQAASQQTGLCRRHDRAVDRRVGHGDHAVP